MELNDKPQKCLAMFKTTHEAKAELDREIKGVREELGLYKVQLDVAQKGASPILRQRNSH